ncbi:MAG: DUF4173 domain-containing protein [Oscillospiraceae bacterium]|nr:DUF4173 domain-containing protein [Oscillospiraceae bacterium]
MENNIPISNNEIVIETVPVKPPREYKGYETVFAWLCLFAGYLFCKSFPVRNNPLGGFILILFLFITSTVVLKVKGAKFCALPIIAAISAVLVSSALILSANRTVCFFAYAYAIVIYCYYLYAVTGNSIKKGFTDFIAIDFIKALIVMPFESLGLIFKALFSGKAKKGGKFVLKIIIGVAIAAIPTVIVLGLLSYDDNFWNLLKKIFDFDGFDIFSHITSIIFGVPVGMYLFGAFVSASDNKCSTHMTAESCSNAYQKMKIAPAVTVIAAVLPVLFLYVVFFISQWSYYMSGFTGVLPEAFSYAEYAREGFFQLCIVSVINLLIISAVIVFMRRRNKGMSVLLKIISLIFSVFTLILIATAISKLVMYIDYYGLTPKRVHAAWFMAVLAVIFILVAVKQFVKKLNVVAVSIAVLVVMFAAIAVPNTDGFIAEYNVDRYLSGTLETVDAEAMEDLGLAAVPQMVRLAEILRERGDDRELYDETMDFLQRMNRRYFSEEPDLFTYTVPYVRAGEALKNILITKKPAA